MSVKTLVIVESPAKCNKIGSFLGPNYIVKASFGHIRGIIDGLKAIDFTNDYKIKYDIIETKKKQVAELRKASKECGNVIIASDADREGEAIGFHLSVVLGLNPHTVSRITFQEITKKAITAAVAKPGKLDMNLVYSQEARCVLDLLVGFELSPLVSQFVGGKLSAGRCQSPAVRLVLEREQDISKQDTTSSFKINVILHPESLKLQLVAHFKKTYSEKESVLEIYNKMKKNSCYQINDFQSKVVEHAPPKPYTTSTVQQDCSSVLSMNPKETMSILQKLYEGGKITYMRTDSIILSQEALAMLADEVKTRFGEEYHQYRVYKNKGDNAQEAHEAIRPTHVDEYPLKNSDKEEWSAREARVYELVWKRTMASQMANQRIQRHTTTIDMYFDKPSKKYVDDQLECVIDQLEFDGWRKLYKRQELSEGTEQDDEEKPAEASLEDMKALVKEPRPKLLYSSAEAKQNYTRSLCRYTEASLIKDLESKSIGRPSTYANIMETIIRERAYVEVRDFPGVEKDVETLLLNVSGAIKVKTSKTTLGKEKKKLTISPLGENVMKFLLAQFENIMNYNFTKQVEDELDQICHKKSTYSQVVHRVYQSFHPKVVQLKLSSPEVRQLVGGKTGNIDMGSYEDEQGEDSVILKNGPYGHYIQFRGENFGLKFVSEERKRKIIEELDVEEAVNVIDEQIAAKKRKEEEKSEIIQVGKYEIKKGPYGFYFTFNKKNYGIGQKDPANLTENDCREIMSSKKEWEKTKSAK